MNSEDEVDVAGCCHVTIEETFDHDTFEEDVEVIPLSLGDGGQSMIDELKEVNLGTIEEPRPTFISIQLSDDDENEYVNLLKGYKNVFAWSYKEMSGIDPKVVVHRLAIKPEHRIKKYLLNLLILSAPAIGKPLILYIVAQETSLGTLLAHENDKGKECALYYLSRTLIRVELNYSPIEKMCLALFFAIDKLRHYMYAFTIHLVAKVDPVKYILSRPVISRRLAKWAIILQQYDIAYISQKIVRGQALTDFLADHSVPSNWKLCDDLPDKEVLFVESMEPWTMFFDVAVRKSGAGVSIVFISPEKHMLSYSFTLRKEESTKALEEAHSGICGAHQSGLKLQHQLKRMGYY
ncbi:uncharacterized protein E6C27_scaffold222G00180 [Cucumis melo var. makuwa]|uniref:Reverse transcriptase RNase H-like domain-containing protein n=1 Tax=Cucumis melo var. makuwa TaxID=1194695 RepID=A0A5A7UPN9_CUCMM|nr:uncharacterized protein E6C27_scaffold222G00180 [Cucumis melo var. makuwa]